MTHTSTPYIARPFVKWAGGKSQMLHAIRAKYPAELGRRINKYAEPFVGGGAVLFDVLNRYSLDAVYVSDINAELVHTYHSIRDNVGLLVAWLKDFEREYLPATTEARKNIYYEKRDRFNALKLNQPKSLEVAALFVFLNRTCFNGLYRVNAKGGYNVPQGNYKKPCICDEDNLYAVSRSLQNVTIVNGDYKIARDFIDDRTFCYFDPPYRPLSATASFTAYAQDGFDDAAQAELARFIDRLSESGASVLASNSDPKNMDETDDFFDRLYARHEIARVDACRAINAVGSGRGRIKELLITSAKRRGNQMRNFNEWIAQFKTSISDYGYYIDFEKIYRNIDAIKVELNILNSLIGSKNIERDFEDIVTRYPETLKCVPLLLAIRGNEIYATDSDGAFRFSFKQLNYSVERYKMFMRKTGLFDLLENHVLSNLVDYATGVETGLDSNGRKNRGGHLMENLVESHLVKAGFEKNVTYFKEMKIRDIESWGIDLSAITNGGKTVKRFDFVVKTDAAIYGIETNFYNGGGSKLNETARSYKTIALESKHIHGFVFVWFTDGNGWKSARNNLEETFGVMDHIYSIADLDDGIMRKIFL